MPSILDKIRTALKRPASTTAQLADALTDARRAAADATHSVERQVEAVAAGYLDADDKRAAARSKLADLRAEAEDAAAILAEVERRHGAALAADEDARRQAVYADAKAKADAAALALAKTYPKLAAGLVAMLKDLAEAQLAVVAANASLPDGAIPLADPEMMARGFSGFPREIVSDEDVEAWGSIERSVPLDEQFQSAIYDVGNGYGKRGHYIGGQQSMGEPAPNYRRRRFRKVTYREAVPGVHPYSLACAIRLPTVVGERMLWGSDHLVHDPALTASMMGEGQPDAVLARVAIAEPLLNARPPKPERVLKVEYPSYVEVVPFPPEQPMEQRAGKPSGTGSRFSASPFAAPGSRPGARR